VFVLSESDVEVEGGRRVRPRITLSSRAGVVWEQLSRAERVRLASLFSELVVYYAETGRMPVVPIKVLLEASEMVARAYDVCKSENNMLKSGFEKLERDLEACRGELRGAQARIAETESRLKGEVEELRAKLEKAQDRVKQLEVANEKLNMSVRITARRFETLKFICQAYETLLRVARSEAERAELDLLCRGER